MNIRINTLADLQAYMEALAAANGLAYYYLDSNYNIEERLEHFYNNVNKTGSQAFIFSVFDTSLSQAGSSVTATIISQIMVLKKITNEATDPNALKAVRAATWATAIKLKGSIMLDQQETWENMVAPSGKPVDYGKWWLEIGENDAIMPESDVASSGAYGFLLDLNVSFSANYVMFN